MSVFELSCIFWGWCWAVANIGLSLKSNHQIKLSLSKSLTHTLAWLKILRPQGSSERARAEKTKYHTGKDFYYWSLGKSRLFLRHSKYFSILINELDFQWTNGSQSLPICLQYSLARGSVTAGDTGDGNKKKFQ